LSKNIIIFSNNSKFQDNFLQARRPVRGGKPYTAMLSTPDRGRRVQLGILDAWTNR